MFKIKLTSKYFTLLDSPKFCSATGSKCDIKVEVKFMQESGEPDSILRSDINEIAFVKNNNLSDLYICFC